MQLNASVGDGIGRALRSFGHWAGKFPSMGFGLAYLAAIPLFAACYTWMPFDFWNGTARYEPMITAQREQIASKLRENFLGEHSHLNKMPVQVSRDNVFPMFSLEPQPNSVRVIVWIINEESKETFDPFVRVALEVDQSSQIMTTKEGWDVLGSVRARVEMLSSQKIDLPSLFPCSHGKWPKATTCLTMTLSEYNDMLSLSSTERGLPTRRQNSYSRMLYFSAVTMSTLGYGDIVPLTSRARGLVTLQVILGPILFGLFLNSLAGERRNSRSAAAGQ